MIIYVLYESKQIFCDVSKFLNRFKEDFCSVFYVYYQTISGIKSSTDVLFLLDTSGSVPEKTLSAAKKYIEQMLKDFTITPNDIRVGIINFGDRIDLVLPLNQGTSSRNVMDALYTVKPIGGKSNIQAAYKIAKDIFDGSTPTLENGKRGRVLINILTNDVISTEAFEKAAENVRESDVNIGIVNINGALISDETLEEVVGRKDYFLRLENIDQFPRAIEFAYKIVSKSEGG